jgi:hypothetical protein
MMPILLVPGLGGSPRLFAPVAPALWRFGPVTVANHMRRQHGRDCAPDPAEAPSRFALAGIPWAATCVRNHAQAPQRVAKLALIAPRRDPIRQTRPPAAAVDRACEVGRLSRGARRVVSRVGIRAA